jgi:hypothetical protein
VARPSQLILVLAGLQADQPASLVAGRRIRLDVILADRNGLQQRRDADVSASAHPFRRVTAPAMSLCTRRATPLRLSAQRRRDDRGSPSIVLAAGSKGQRREASSGPPERRKYHRPRTPANNEMKLTSSASFGGRRLQLISVFGGRQ